MRMVIWSSFPSGIPPSRRPKSRSSSGSAVRLLRGDPANALDGLRDGGGGSSLTVGRHPRDVDDSVGDLGVPCLQADLFECLGYLRTNLFVGPGQCPNDVTTADDAQELVSPDHGRALPSR